VLRVGYSCPKPREKKKKIHFVFQKRDRILGVWVVGKTKSGRGSVRGEYYTVTVRSKRGSLQPEPGEKEKSGNRRAAITL